MNNHSEKGFTLIELLIVVTVIIILVIIALMLINPTKQRQKLYDSQRKRDLSRLKVLNEDYYLQKQIYPRGEEICFDTPTNNNGVCSCHICGLARNNKVFGELVNILYCDPEHPLRGYLYEYDCSGPEPQWYKIYAQLSTTGNSCSFGVSNFPDTALIPYPNSCDISGSATGNDGNGSNGTPTPELTAEPTSGNGGGTEDPTPTPTLPFCPNDPQAKYCILGGICNICGNFSNCLNASSCDQPPQLYSNSACTNSCQFGQSGPTSTPIPTPTVFPWGDCPVDPDPKYCFNGSTCNNCGTFENCTNQGTCNSPLQLFGNETCNGICYEE